jgi:hypothetical protein
MARPKGSTLSALFEVSEQERQAFYERIQKKIHPVEDVPIQEAGAPVKGIPETGVPETGVPISGIPLISPLPLSLLPTPPNKRLTAPESSILVSGIPVSGIPASGIPGIPDFNTSQKTGIPFLGAPGKGIPLSRPRIRRAIQVQDGHSLGEQLILTTLWNGAATVESQTYRRISIGYRTLSGVSGLTVNNCKANLKSLQAKLAIEPETTYSTTSATTYRVYSFAEILRRREAAGLTHVLRNRGSTFVHHETGIPFSGIPPVPVTGIPDSEKGIPEAGEKGIPEAGALLRIKKKEPLKEHPSSDVAIVSQGIHQYLTIDDAAVRLIIEGCRRNDPNCTMEEIAHFAAVSAAKIRQQRNVDNPAGLLINQAPLFFPGAELTAYRARKAREHADNVELARKVLSDPESPQETKQWARTLIPDAR